MKRTPLAQLVIFRHAHWSLLQRLTPAHIRREGHTFFLDRTDSMGLSHGEQTAFPIRFLETTLATGDIVIDIGAHIGYFTLSFARMVGKEGHVFAFEPDPTNFSLLRKNVEQNGYDNVTLVNKAVADETGRVPFYLSRCSALSRLHASTLCHRRVHVDAVRLDDYFASRESRIALIKMDVEGSELLALKGMENLLAQNTGANLFTEFGPCWLREAGFDSQEFLTVLQEWGFEIQVLDEINETLEAVGVEHLISQYSPQSGRVANLWCTRSRKGA